MAAQTFSTNQSASHGQSVNLWWNFLLDHAPVICSKTVGLNIIWKVQRNCCMGHFLFPLIKRAFFFPPFSLLRKVKCEDVFRFFLCPSVWINQIKTVEFEIDVWEPYCEHPFARNTPWGFALRYLVHMSSTTTNNWLCGFSSFLDVNLSLCSIPLPSSLIETTFSDTVAFSVTILSGFWTISVTNFHVKVAQLISVLKIRTLKVKNTYGYILHCSKKLG